MKNKNYGFLIADADKADRVVFAKFLSSNMHAVNFEKDKEKDLGDYSMQLKTTENLNIFAIGHGYAEDKFINEKGKEHTAVTVIEDVKECLDKLSTKVNVKLSERVRNFRLQACHQGGHAEKEADGIKKALGEYNSAKPITFSCPKHFSFLEKDKTSGDEKCYLDTDASSHKEYEEKKKNGTLKYGKSCTFELSVKPEKTFEEVKKTDFGRGS